MKRTVFLALLLLLMTGCSHIISESSLKLVDPTITFEELRKNPDAFIGKTVLLGGMIAGSRNTKEGGELEVVQFELDHEMPIELLRSGGRFLVVSADFLDELIYTPGSRVTVVGTVKGKKIYPLDQADYTYPVISLKEIHLWPKEEQTGFPPPMQIPTYNFNPYYDGYYGDPYWYRPPGPPIRH